MRLTHKDYVQPVKEDRVVPDVKGIIKTFVGKGTESYEDIVKKVQESVNLTNDEIIKQIKEVSKEADFLIKEVVEKEL